MNPADQIIADLEAYGCTVTMTGESACMATCTAHDDRTPSLSVGLGTDGCGVVHCHAGCETVDVLRPLGRTLRDLFPGRDDDRPGSNARVQRGHSGQAVQRPRTAKPSKPKSAALPSEDQLRGWADQLQT